LAFSLRVALGRVEIRSLSTAPIEPNPGKKGKILRGRPKFRGKSPDFCAFSARKRGVADSGCETADFAQRLASE
jgi:hypothetical protein